MQLCLQHPREPLHHFNFVIEHTVGVSIERDRSVLMPHNIGDCFYIHSALDGASGKRMAQGVKVELAHSRAFGEFFEHILV